MSQPVGGLNLRGAVGAAMQVLFHDADPADAAAAANAKAQPKQVDDFVQAEVRRENSARISTADDPKEKSAGRRRRFGIFRTESKPDNDKKGSKARALTYLAIAAVGYKMLKARGNDDKAQSPAGEPKQA